MSTRVWSSEPRAIDPDGYDVFENDDDLVADMLASDLVLSWAQGRYEIGLRALGNGSILAAPFKDETRVRLNEIQQREQFRPLLPVFLREDAETWFGCDHDAPQMLFTYRATTGDLRVVMHDNGTARLQTVTSDSAAGFTTCSSRSRSARATASCATLSLNFKGGGFIDNLTDLDVYAAEHGLDGYVVEGRVYPRKGF